MKQKHLLFSFSFVLALMGLICSSTAYGQATLKHSYTFDDGTANDMVGNADGVIEAGEIVNGAFVADANGEYITFPAGDIAINTYSAISVEAFITADVDNTGATMMIYFGGNENGVGGNGFFVTPDRWTQSYCAISCGNLTAPYNNEEGVAGDPVSVGDKHHIACILTNSLISFYIDGQLVGTNDVGVAHPENMISALSNDFAWLCKGGYNVDPTWRGSVYEYNVYEGELSEALIKQHAAEFVYGPGSYNDPTLASLSTVPGTLDPPFDPATADYEVYVPYGTTLVQINAVPTIAGATVSMWDGLGNEITDGNVNFTGDGVDVEIIVTALDGTTELSYYVSIFLDPSAEAATLSNILLSTGKLTKKFHSDTLNYIVIVPYGTTSVDVTGVKTWAGATMTGGGTVTLTDGMGSTTITVTSEDQQHTLTYTIDIYETIVRTGQFYYIVHEVSELVATESGQSPNRLTLQYAALNEASELWEFIESGDAGQFLIKNQLGHYISLYPPDANGGTDWHLVIRENLPVDLDSSRFVIEEFESGRFRIRSVTRMNSADPARQMMSPNNGNLGTVVYSDKWAGSSWDNAGLTIWNIKYPEDVVDPYDTYLADMTLLNDMSVNLTPLYPVFDFGVKEYWVTFPEGTTSVTIDATPRDATATVSGTGTVSVSAEGGDLVVTCTATDTQYSTEYVIHYIVDPHLTLMHSYTFADGTAQDMAGDLDGVVHGGSITDGTFTSAVDGDYITVDPVELAINTYPSITLEAYVTTGVNAGWTMLAYFGNTGGNYSYWMSIARNDDVSKTAVDLVGSAEIGPVGLEPGAGENHHYVSVLTNDTLYWYVDGLLVGKSELPSNYRISDISDYGAWICYGGYSDPTWYGDLYEFNIYAGQMDPMTVASRAINFPVDDATTDATLSDLTVDGVTIDNFASYLLNYEVILSPGTVDVPVVAATPKNASASAVVTDATEVPGTTTVLVTAEDGVTTVTYTIDFIFEKSNIATLSDLQVDGVTVDGFDPETTTYNVELPHGTTVVPTVTATTTDANAKVVVTPAASLPGNTTVKVTAEDGVTIKTYTVKFTVAVSVGSLKGNRNIKVYPTLSREGQFKVETPGGLSTISVYNIAGTIVSETTTHDQVTEISIDRPGMYILRVENDGMSEVFKVFKTN